MTTKLRDEVYSLNSEEVTWTETDIETTQTSKWLEGARYQVPVGQAIVFRPEDVFSFYGKDKAGSELTIADKVRILVKDPAQEDTKLILGPCRYMQVSEFQEDKLLKRLDIMQEYIANEGYWIIIEWYVAVSFDVSTCWWNLTCRRIRSAIF